MTSFSQFRRNYVAGEGVHFVSIPERARGIQGEGSGFTSRFISVLFDMGLVAVGIIGVYWLWQGLRYVLSFLYDVPNIEGVPLLFLGYLLMWLYWAWAWAIGGKSLGNQLMGLRVQRIGGEPLGVRKAAVRSLFSVFFPIGLGWVLISKKNRSVQDIVLRTEVVFDWKPLIPRAL